MLAILLALAASSWHAGPEMRDTGFQMPLGAPASVTIAAMPYTRTVTCTNYTLTGTATGGAAVTWAASPSGASGACTGTTSWSCVVDVAPDAVGEGVEVITVTSGTATDTETIGFYFEGEHSCFLAQSINGGYNTGMTDLDAVATWKNIGSSALDVTQATGTLQPKLRTSIVGGQPVVRCDGGDTLTAATAADWVFLANGSNSTTSAAAIANSTGTRALLSTSNFNEASANSFSMMRIDTTRVQVRVNGGAGQALSVNTAIGSFLGAIANAHTVVIADDAGAGNDIFAYLNNNAVVQSLSTAAYAASSVNPLSICSFGGAGGQFTGDILRVLIYQSALDATQRGINKAVDEWALGGTLPVTP